MPLPRPTYTPPGWFTRRFTVTDADRDHVLGRLAQAYSRRLTVGQLRDETGLGGWKLRATVRDLERRGLVFRRHRRSERTAVLVCLTANGIAEAPAVDAEPVEVEDEVAA